MYIRQDNDNQSNLNHKIEQYFIPFSSQIERIIKVTLLILVLTLFLAQSFILTAEDNQAMVNKAIRYEGVFQDDPIEAKATLQRNQ